MNLFRLFLFTAYLLTSQITIDVYRWSQPALVFGVEDQILEIIQELHKRKTNEEIHFNIIKVTRFSDILTSLTKTKNEFSMSMSGISITSEREKLFSFSVPYIFVSECIIRLKESEDRNWKEKGSRIGYMPGSTFEQKIKVLSKKYPIQPVAIKYGVDGFTALKSRNVDFILADNIYVWENKGLKIVHEFKNDVVSGYGIVFKKKSVIKKILDPYLDYIIRSSGFRSKILKLYGNEYIDFFKNKFY